MDSKAHDDPGRKLPTAAKPREGSLRREVERAEHEPKPHRGRQLIGPGD